MGREPQPDVCLECSLPEPCACVLANDQTLPRFTSLCALSGPQTHAQAPAGMISLVQSSNQLAPVTQRYSQSLGSTAVPVSQGCPSCKREHPDLVASLALKDRTTLRSSLVATEQIEWGIAWTLVVVSCC